MLIQNQLITKSKSFDFNLETLRGVAAILVIWGHATVANGWIDPNYYPKGVWSYIGPAHLSVLVFFLLSGYVIGLAHKNPLTILTIPIYLKKRFVRIYPIYIICLLLALLVSKQHYAGSAILGHLAMTQGVLTPFIQAINPSWSLTYEVVFYLLFIPLSTFRVNPVPVALLAVLIGCVDAYFYPRYGFSLLPSFAFGFAFWLSGLALAKYLVDKESKRNYAFMLSFLFLFMAVGKLDAPTTLFHQVSLHLFGKNLSEISNNQPGVIALRDFGYLPYCIVILIVFVGKGFRYQRFVMIVLLLLPAPTLYHYYRHLLPEQWSTLTLPIIFYALAILLFIASRQMEMISQRVIKSLIVTGGLSYGLYIIHYPILYLFGHTVIFSGTPFTFIVRLGCFLVLVISGAYLLEKKFQPLVRGFFF